MSQKLEILNYDCDHINIFGMEVVQPDKDGSFGKSVEIKKTGGMILQKSDSHKSQGGFDIFKTLHETCSLLAGNHAIIFTTQ